MVDVDGTRLRFIPHDFRRIFSTETVNGGLPIHIAAKVLGHLDLNTTQGYVVVYPEEVIRHYRHFVDQRRAARPGEEYREPTNAEWAYLRDHFSLRKVALGICERPYGTPCQQEHACFSELTGRPPSEGPPAAAAANRSPAPGLRSGPRTGPPECVRSRPGWRSPAKCVRDLQRLARHVLGCGGHDDRPNKTSSDAGL
ncbi:tyrosine-type recombinase/integrase [Streptomyces sp. NPDC056638]|uniref:tyrosine-type recombinase/integrase n=1 Tax=Streptomyces sp. NPDC056638 TaxID=3345887 RepID=UPI003674CE00